MKQEEKEQKALERLRKLSLVDVLAADEPLEVIVTVGRRYRTSVAESGAFNPDGDPHDAVCKGCETPAGRW